MFRKNDRRSNVGVQMGVQCSKQSAAIVRHFATILSVGRRRQKENRGSVLIERHIVTERMNHSKVPISAKEIYGTCSEHHDAFYICYILVFSNWTPVFAVYSWFGMKIQDGTGVFPNKPLLFVVKIALCCYSVIKIVPHVRIDTHSESGVCVAVCWQCFRVKTPRLSKREIK